MRIPWARAGSVVLGAALIVLTAKAAEVTVSALVAGPPPPPTPADTIVAFRGIAYPSSAVSFERDGTLLAQVPADPAARFDVSFGNQPAGSFTYAVFSSDAQGRRGSTANFSLTITQGTTVTITGVFLGPTIEADRDRIRLDETVTILGITAPSSEVTIFVSSEETRTFKANAGADGIWTKQFLGSDVGVGDHHIRAKAVTSQDEISAFSDSLALTVSEKAREKCDGKNRADLNCDGKVNLTDFSILLFYWKQRNPANARADINRDGRVDLRDLSIMLFNWTR